MEEERRLSDFKDLMEDRVRMIAYQEAIRRACPGKKVCEIGLGLGPLTLMALDAGAEKVYGIEFHKTSFEMTRAILKANRVDPARYELHLGLSTKVTLPEKVDLVLSETLDHLGIGENTVHFMKDARDRLLKPDGIFLPDRLQCLVSLGSPGEYLEELRFWNESLNEDYGLDYTLIGEILKKKKHVVWIKEDELHSSWAPWQEIRFNPLLDPSGKQSLILEVTKPGRIEGICHAFDVRLCEGVGFSTLPDQPPTHWQQGFVPFSKPIDAARGDIVHLTYNTVQGADGFSMKLQRQWKHVPEAEAGAYVASTSEGDCR